MFPAPKMMACFMNDFLNDSNYPCEVGPQGPTKQSLSTQLWKFFLIFLSGCKIASRAATPRNDTIRKTLEEMV